MIDYCVNLFTCYFAAYLCIDLHCGLLGDGGTVKPNPNQIEIVGATTVEPCCKYAAEADVSSIINQLIVKWFLKLDHTAMAAKPTILSKLRGITPSNEIWLQMIYW